MKNPRAVSLSVPVAVFLLLLAGCGEAAAPKTVETPTKTDPPTKTLAPSKTGKPTLTLTPTETPTETPTFTPTLPYNAPGTYNILRCTSYQFKARGSDRQDTVRVCVNYVTIQDDGVMRFFAEWTAVIDYYHPYSLLLEGFGGDANVVLMDNLENEYRYTVVGGCLAAPAVLEMGSNSCGGWFDFPAAKPGATSFSFIDFQHGVSVDNIVLLPKLGTDTPTHTQTALQGTPYNEPGTYWLYKCITYPPGGGLVGASYVSFCLNTVNVYENRTMRFNVVWKIYFDNPANVRLDPAVNTFYLEDDLGNEYTPAQYGGCALEGLGFSGKTNPGSCNGWFQFEPAQPGATSFRLVDMFNHVSIENIVLVPKAE